MSYFSKSLVIAAATIVLGSAALAKESPATIEGATTVTVEEAATLFDEEVVFVDVRKASDYDAGRIAGSVHLDVKSEFTEENLAEHVGKDDPVVIYCNGHSCLRSSQASSMAVSWGYSKVYYLRDGFPAWDVAGHMVE